MASDRRKAHCQRPQENRLATYRIGCVCQRIALFVLRGRPLTQRLAPGRFVSRGSLPTAASDEYGAGMAAASS